MMLGTGFPTIFLLFGLLIALVGTVIWELMKRPIIAARLIESTQLIPAHTAELEFKLDGHTALSVVRL